MIYTGYFAQTKMYVEQGLQVVSIAGKAPDFFKGPKYPSLAPSYSMFMDWKKGKIDNMQYTALFKEHLNTLDKEAVKRFLNSFDKEVILLCYEKTGDFCHRHIVADWIESEIGWRVEEYDGQRIEMIEAAIEELQESWMSVNDLNLFLRFNCANFLERMRNEPPEGYILVTDEFEDEPVYMLEKAEDILKSYGITEEDKSYENIYERY